LPPVTDDINEVNGEKDVRDVQERRKPEIGSSAQTKEASASEHAVVLLQLKELVRSVHEERDEEALGQLREILNEAPTLARRLMDPAKQAELSMIKNYAGNDLLAKEILPRALRAMREELGGKDPSPLESLLVERVVATWLSLQYYEGLYVQNMRALTVQQSEHHQKRIDRAHRRHLSAVRTLAQVRKLLKGKPRIAQINLAEKQINTAS
jgi:hypothetical protein